MTLLPDSSFLSLVGFCPICYRNNRPQMNEPFLTYGSHQKKFHIYFVEHHGVRGYTPHLVKYKRVGENVIYQQACGICDMDFWKDETGKVIFDITHWERRVMSIQEWNAWVSYHTDSDYYI